MNYLLFQGAKEEGGRRQGGSLNSDQNFRFQYLGKVKKFQIIRYMRLGAIAIYARGGASEPPPLRGRVKKSFKQNSSFFLGIFKGVSYMLKRFFLEGLMVFLQCFKMSVKGVCGSCFEILWIKKFGKKKIWFIKFIEKKNFVKKMFGIHKILFNKKLITQ